MDDKSQFLKKDFILASKWAGGIAAYCFIATALTRYGDPENAIIGSYGIFRKLCIVLSFPSVVVVRIWKHEAGDYISNSDIFNLLWLNLITYTVLIFAFLWLRRLWKGLDQAPESKRRRNIIVGAAAGVGAVGAGFYLRKDVDNLEVVQQELNLPNLPPAMEGWRLGLMADWHLGPYISEEYLRRVVEVANAQNLDLTCVVGDFVYQSPRYIEPVSKLLAELRPRVGLLGTLGNHDHWQGADKARQCFTAVGMRMLDNRRIYLHSDGTFSEQPSEQCLCLAGVGDCWEDVIDYRAALDGVPNEVPRLLFAHNPDCAEDQQAGNWRVDALLAGHTHGGQVSLPILGTVLVPTNYGDKYVAGWATGPHFNVYTNRGIGMTVLPIRSGARPEITVFTLHRT